MAATENDFLTAVDSFGVPSLARAQRELLARLRAKRRLDVRFDRQGADQFQYRVHARGVPAPHLLMVYENGKVFVDAQAFEPFGMTETAAIYRALVGFDGPYATLSTDATLDERVLLALDAVAAGVLARRDEELRAA